MSYQSNREVFMAWCGAQIQAPYHAARVARKLMAHASTLQRLAAAQCNGDWPADNGERTVIACPLCEQSWVPSAIVGGKLAMLALTHTGGNRFDEPNARACPDCRISAAVRELVRVNLPQWQAIIEGDPRSYVVRLAPAQATRDDISAGRTVLVYVPGRE